MEQQTALKVKKSIVTKYTHKTRVKTFQKFSQLIITAMTKASVGEQTTEFELGATQIRVVVRVETAGLQVLRDFTSQFDLQVFHETT